MKKLAASYKQQPITNKYEVIVIGSGMGGMTVASMLAQEGRRVLVLERHYTPGGYTHIFKRQGYEWDVGVHYIGEVNKATSLTRQVFDYISNDALQWAEMGEVYDRILFGEETFDLVKGTEAFKARLKEYFPEKADRKAIDKYVNLVYKVARAARGFFAVRAMPRWLAWLLGPLMKYRFARYAYRTTLDVLRKLTNNEKLIAVLTGQYGDYGLPPGQSSFGMHAMVAKHYFRGGNYPVGGSAKIFESIAPIIEKAGGRVYVNAEVRQIVVRDGEAVGVKMADDRLIYGNTIISDAGIINTYRHLLPDTEASKFGLTEQLEELHPSASHICLYIGLAHSAEALDLGTTNYWMYPPNYDHDAVVQRYLDDPENNPLPVTYISFPSAKDPDWEHRYPGKATIEIITLAPYEWFAKWAGKRWKKRGEAYEAFKEKLSQRLLEQLYKVKPQVKGKIAYYELSTPLSTQHFTNYKQGEIYGIEHSPQRFKLDFIRPATPIKHLYLTGQDLTTAGVGGALFGGVLTASAILKKDMLRHILKVQKQKREGK